MLLLVMYGGVRLIRVNTRVMTTVDPEEVAAELQSQQGTLILMVPLGGYPFDKRHPSVQYAEEALRIGVELQQRGKHVYIVLSGGDTLGKKDTEAEATLRLVDQHLVEQFGRYKILLEKEALTTYGNMAKSQSLLEKQKISGAAVIVAGSGDWFGHAQRAALTGLGKIPIIGIVALPVQADIKYDLQATTVTVFGGARLLDWWATREVDTTGTRQNHH